MRSYYAILTKDSDSDWSVHFPDFPGCVTAGNSPNDAFRMAGEALELHTAAMVEDGETLPVGKDLDAVIPELSGSRAVLTIHIPDPPTKIANVDVSVPEPDLKAIDEHAEKSGLTRSGFLVEAAKAAMARGVLSDNERRRA